MTDVVHYLVVSYVPDPVTQEHTNMGVLVLDDVWCKARVLSQPPRHLDTDSADVVLATVNSIVSMQCNEDMLRDLSGEWAGVVQLTEPRPTVKRYDQTIAELRDELFTRFCGHWESQIVKAQHDALTLTGTRFGAALMFVGWAVTTAAVFIK